MKKKITRRKFMTHMVLMSALGSYGCRNGFLTDLVCMFLNLFDGCTLQKI
jgi:hypothetical protein